DEPGVTALAGTYGMIGASVRLGRGGSVEAQAECGRGDDGGGPTGHGAQVRDRYQWQPGAHGGPGAGGVTREHADITGGVQHGRIARVECDVVDRCVGQPAGDVEPTGAAV